jgi:small subunit ribosomal protein S21
VARNRTYFPEEKSGICVVKREGEHDDDLIKRFRKKFSKSGLAKELRERMYFEKPSDKKRRRKAQCIRNIHKEEEKLRLLKEKAKKAKQKRQRKEWKHDKCSKRQNNYGKTYEDKTRRDYSS